MEDDSAQSVCLIDAFTESRAGKPRSLHAGDEPPFLFKNLVLFAGLDYGDTAHQWSNFLTFTIEALKQSVSEAAKALLALLSCVTKNALQSSEV
jgi:hypothetical protein